MEFITLLLSGLLGILAPVGIVADTIAENTIRDRLHAAEHFAVRIDNAPTHQLLNGRVNKIRLAGRGIFPLADIRIAALDLETDHVAIDPSQVRRGKIELDQPLNVGVQLILTQTDLNQALQSTTIANYIKSFSVNAIGGSAQQLQQYDFINPQIELLPADRIRFQVTLQQQSTNPPPNSPANPRSQTPQSNSASQLRLSVESQLQVLSGTQLQLIDPVIRVNGEALPAELVAPLTQGINQQLDLSRLENQGITARILALSTQNQQLTLRTFVRLDPRFTASGT